MIYLGFDTSNYTTSVSAFGEDTKESIRSLLKVKQNERGLRQSDAVFQHIKNLPGLFFGLSEKINMNSVAAVGVSTRPRNVDGSYMPVFLAGEGYARVCAASLGVPVYEFSHQDGHIMAGIESCGCHELMKKPFICVHLSGGTCEILLTEFKEITFSCRIIGGTKDISAGQLIDRVGVALGMGFPCGKQMEETAKECDCDIKLPVSVDKSYINFSGIETKTLSLIDNYPSQVISSSLFLAIAKALEKSLDYCISEYNINDILIVGGVASNSIIKNYLKEKLLVNVHFASAEYSTDNAFGIAILTKIIHENTGKGKKWDK